MRNSMRRSGGTPALRSTMPFCTSIAQRTASTTLRNSMRAAVAGALDDAPVMHGDGRVDEVAAQRPQPRERAVLVRAGEPAVADDVGGQDRCDFPGLAHGAPQARRTLAQRPVATAPLDVALFGRPWATLA